MNDFFEILKINYYSFVDACYFVYSEFSCSASENQQDFFENGDFSDPEMKGRTLNSVNPLFVVTYNNIINDKCHC